MSKDKSRLFTGKRQTWVYIYLFDVNLDDAQCLMSIKEERDLWHKKLGHVNMKQISKISLKDFCSRFT